MRHRTCKTRWTAPLLALLLAISASLLVTEPVLAAGDAFGNTDQLDLSKSEDLIPRHDGSDGLAGGYVIDAYHLDIEVKEDHSYEVKETIQAYFTSRKHGLIRTIPTAGTYRREDGTSGKYRARLTDIKANTKASVQRSSGKTKIKLGDGDSYVYGPVKYQFSYQYHLGRETLKGADEFYFNLIGADWDTTIGNVTFKITMPEDITEEEARSLGFTSGGYGSTRTGDTLYQIEGRTIQGKLMRQLKSNQAYTVRMTLPEGYFIQPLDYGIILTLGLALLGVVIAVIFWLLFGNDRKVIESVQFYPPEGYNSLDVAMAYRGKVRASDIPTLIPYLANEGYLTIEENPDKKEIGKRITYEKKAGYSGNNESERLFLKGLFKKGSRVKHSDLIGGFYQTCEDILKRENLHSKVKDENYTNRDIFLNAVLLALVMLLSFVAVLGGLSHEGASTGMSLALGLIFALLMCFVAVRVSGSARIAGFNVEGMNGMSLPLLLRHLAGSGLSIGLIAIICYAGKVFLSSLIGAFSFLTGGLLIRVLIAVAATLIISFFMHFMPKRTKKGDEIYGRILGFRTFLQTAERDRLQMLVDENPQYFYNIIPFAYVLGVSKVWMDKFKDIVIPAPSYVVRADSRDVFWNYYYYSSLMDAVNRDIYHASVTPPAVDFSGSHSGDSGFGSFGGGSGGGFSGGGSGGGGGGSW